MSSKEQQAKSAEQVINLSQSELKIITLGVRFSDAGKVDYEKVAKYGGWTKGSAQVLYRKALRKLMDAFPVDEEAESADPSAADPVTPGPKSASKGGKRRASTGKKRKDVENTPVELVTGGAGDAESPTPAKRQRKTLVKKTPVKYEPLAKDEEEDVAEPDDNNNAGTEQDSVVVKPEPEIYGFTSVNQ
ncbi:hypothetical protein BGW36DRAFT_383869 [Talaromyces proteolyticus]|uniref:Histone h1.3 n=1 Tax=Talaromyces proteolyticus TaxID=1131652 RepID=A0AAD4KRA4_9EURO|nr:uncharacterized protein BGW36DRAFT_383869 [Talaromyces proteolyticus]KAH8693857.1 hypothetical protein BGW36DRAFT_383869 [Talaromyces proteolyticus]